MKSLCMIRLALSLFALALAASPAAAQMRDREEAVPHAPVALVAEPAAPVVPRPVSATLTDEQCRHMLRQLINTLELQPYQVVIVRRALVAIAAGVPWDTALESANPDAPRPSVTPSHELQMVLSEKQLARLLQWEKAQPQHQRIDLLALAQ